MIKQNLLTALVIDNNDPEKLGRVLVSLPALPEGPELWARMVTPLAGENRGICFLPEIGDEVLVAFSQGELASAYILGGLWGKEKQPPEDLDYDGNNLKMIRTRAGHTLIFDDTDDKGRITLIDNKENSLVIDPSDGRITLNAKSTIELITDGDIYLSGKKIILEADNTIEIKSGSSLTLDGGNEAYLKGGTVKIN